MAKNFPLLVLLLIAQSIFTPLFSGNSFDKPETNNFLPDECDAPAPDSFRVTSRGANFITVVWNPVWTGAMHTLAVFTRPNSTSPWSLIDSFNNVAGSTLTVNNVPFDDECKMVIATNCLSGEPSMHKRSLLDKIIIELATGGRIPVNPVPISCMNIPIPTSNSSWIGFQVIKPGFTPQNTFEIRVLQENPSETKIQIKRVYENNIIYASKDDNSIPPPTLVAPNPFKMIMRTLNGDLDIGRIIVTKDISTINLCQANSTPSWNNLFNFTVLKATSANGLTPPPVFENAERTENIALSHTVGKVNVQTPFYETLRIFMEEPSQAIQSATIRMLNINGQTVFEQQIQTPFKQLSFPVKTMPAGIYILHIEAEHEIQTLKVVKAE